MGQTMELWMFNKNAPSTRELFATHILEVDHVYGNRIEEHHFTHDQPLFYGAVSSKRNTKTGISAECLDTVDSKTWFNGNHLYIGDFPLSCFSTESKFFQEFRTALSFLAVLKSFNSTKIGTVLSIGHMWNLAPSLWLGEIHQGH